MDEIRVIPSNDEFQDSSTGSSSYASASDNFDPEITEDDTASFPPLQSAFDYRKVALILFIYLSAGTICFYFLRNQISGKKTNKILDALYITVVSMTAVGYGDLSPDGTLPLLLVSLFSILGMVLLAQVLSKAVDSIIEKQELLLTKAVGTEKLQKEMESNKVRNKFIMLVVLLVVLMAVGTTVLVFLEDLDLIDAYYCINATITTVGSGKCFSTIGGRVFALFWIFCGTIYVGQVFFTFTELYSQRRHKLLEKKVLNKKLTFLDLKTADINKDGVLKLAEYVLHNLVKMKKITKAYIKPILKEFRRVNRNNPGLLESGTHRSRASVTPNGGNQDSSARSPDPLITKSEIGSRHNGNIISVANTTQNQASSSTQPREDDDDKPPTLASPLVQFSHSMWKLNTLSIIYLFAGTICFYNVRHQISGEKTNNVVDALYFTVVLMTSVGYGDLTPETTLAILLASFFAFLGTALLGVFLSVAAESSVTQQEQLQEAVLNHRLLTPAMKTRVKKDLEPSSLMRRKCIVILIPLMVYIGVGMAILVSIENWDFIHALYYVIASITSVGGDKFFSTKGGRVFAVIWILYGVGLIAQGLMIFTELQTHKRQKLVVKYVLAKKMTSSELQAADLDHDGDVEPAEYILHKLQEMKVISEADITPIVEAYQRLIVNNNNGGLTQRDIRS